MTGTNVFKWIVQNMNDELINKLNEIIKTKSYEQLSRNELEFLLFIGFGETVYTSTTKSEIKQYYGGKIKTLFRDKKINELITHV